MIADLSSPYRRSHRHRRNWRRERRAALALLLATALLVVLGGLVHASLTAPREQRLTVRAGDTVWSIATAHARDGDIRAEVDAIMEANHLAAPLLVPGQVLVIPAG